MKDIGIYNERMRKSMMDKIFFMDKIDCDIFVDFGCADGSMIKLLSELFPEYSYVGYDNNHDMIELAKTNVSDGKFFTSWDDTLLYLESFSDKKVCLILSSVLHEVQNKEVFFEFINFEKFDFVAIRDMFYEAISVSKISLSKLYSGLPDRLKFYFDNYIYSWNRKDLIQSVFKSYYVENFDTEILEDYFSFNDSHLLLLENKFNLIPIYRNNYLLPYWRTTIKNDYGVDLTGINTHIQVIFKTK
jgi:SAM-dependent methyltransferase